MGRVHTHLVEVLLMSSLSLRPFSVKVDTVLDKGFLRDRSLLLPHGEGFHPPGQLPPPPVQGAVPVAHLPSLMPLW
jgi:hypothetical protein